MFAIRPPERPPDLLGELEVIRGHCGHAPLSEAHAHVVILIYTPLKQGEPTGKDEIIISKNRHGPMGTIEVTFSRERLKFFHIVENKEMKVRRAIHCSKRSPHINESELRKCDMDTRACRA